MKALYWKEVKSYLNSLIAYLVIVLFLVLTGLVLWVFPETNILDYGYAEMSSFFQLTPLILMFLVPAITMRSFSEEYKTGTISLLFTMPISSRELVLAKLFSAWTLITIAILPTLVYYFLIRNLANPVGNIDTASVVGSYFGLILLAGVFVGIGNLISALTNNQIVAFLLAAFLSYFLYEGLHQTAGLFSGKVNYYLDYFSLQYHYNSLSRGVLDTRNILFLTSVLFLLILSNTMILEKRKK